MEPTVFSEGFNAEPQLAVWVGYFKPPSVREFSDILIALDDAFAEYRVYERLSPKTLVVEHLAINSLSVVCGIVENLTGAIELAEMAFHHRAQLSGFCSDLASIVMAARESNFIPTGEAMRKLVIALARPVAAKRANAVTVAVKGSNGAEVRIEGVLDAIMIEKILRTSLTDEIPKSVDSYLNEEIVKENLPRQLRDLDFDNRQIETNMFWNKDKWVIRLKKRFIKVKPANKMKSLNRSRTYGVVGTLVGDNDRPLFEVDFNTIKGL